MDSKTVLGIETNLLPLPTTSWIMEEWILLTLDSLSLSNSSDNLTALNMFYFKCSATGDNVLQWYSQSVSQNIRNAYHEYDTNWEILFCLV